MAAKHTSTFTFLDKSNEKAGMTIHNGPITAITIAGFLTQFGALKSATEAITLGTLHKEMWVGDNTVLSQALPASVWAQREIKALVSYQGNTSLKTFQVEIPTLDLDAITLEVGSDKIVLEDGGVMEAWVTAFEALAKSPDNDAEAVTVLEAHVVGRNI